MARKIYRTDLNFNLSSKEFEQINWVVRRLQNLESVIETKIDSMDSHMAVTVAHLNGCRLDLDGLYKANDKDFLHDVLGIIAALNKATGKLVDFSPIFKEIKWKI